MKNTKLLQNIIKAILAGCMITIGATVYLSCPNKIIGSFMFSIGLLSICLMDMNLFTGKIGFVTNHEDFLCCLIVWAGNLIGCLIFATAIRISKPQLFNISKNIVETKLSLGVFSIIISAFFCGILMYIAVSQYKEGLKHKRYLFGVTSVIMCVSTFIICGFEHSIADMCYFILGVNSLFEATKVVCFIVIVSIGNGFGALFVSKLLKFVQMLERIDGGK